MGSALGLVCIGLAIAGGCRQAPSLEAAASPSGSPTAKARPFVRVLGSVQDGGFPHAACNGEACRRARSEANPRYIASVALVLPESGKVYLFDATPDVREQLGLLDDVRGSLPNGVDRDPVDGIFLSHAHMGHYLGLAFFGYEAVHTREMPLYVTPSMASFLSENGPWSQLVGKDNVYIQEIPSGAKVELEEGISVTMVPSPHREEYSDTVGFLIRSPERGVLFVPDTDAWRHWSPTIEDWLAQADVALLDGTFFSRDELPNRSIAEIGHPLVTETLERFEDLVSGGKEILFTHMNHSNPILLDNSSEARRVTDAGFEIAREGMEFGL